MKPGITLSIAGLAWNAVDERGFASFTNQFGFPDDSLTYTSDKRLWRWGGYIDASYNFLRRGQYAWYLGSTATAISSGAGYEGGNSDPNPGYFFLGGQLGYARRIGRRGGFHIQIEPGVGGDDVGEDDPRTIGFVLQVKAGTFVF